MMIGQMSWRHYEEKLQHWLLWMMEMSIRNTDFEKTRKRKLPEDSEFQDTKRFTGDRIIVDVSTVAVDGEWYVVVSPYPGINLP